MASFWLTRQTNRSTRYATARQSDRVSDFAPIAMLGLHGLRIFEARGANLSDIG